MRSVTVCLRQRKVRLGLTMNCLVPVIALVVIFAVACVGGGGGATVVPSPSLSQEVATPMHPTPISPLPEATATSTASPWECFPVGIYEHGICRLPGGGLVLDSLGDILATSEMAYPQCPPSWTAVDGAAACLPAADWSVREVAQGTLRVRSTRGSEVLIAQEPSQMIPEFCDPVYTFGLVIHPGQSDMQWCLHVGQRWAHISVVAEAPSDEYYTAFQIALSAGELSPAP